MKAALLNGMWFAVGVAIGSVIMGWESSDARTVVIAFIASAWGHWAGQHHREFWRARAR